jgi:hypothetical protein
MPPIKLRLEGAVTADIESLRHRAAIDENDMKIAQTAAFVA